MPPSPHFRRDFQVSTDTVTLGYLLTGITTPVCPHVNNLGFQRRDGQLLVVWLECDLDKHLHTLELGGVRLDIEVPKNWWIAS